MITIEEPTFAPHPGFGPGLHRSALRHGHHRHGQHGHGWDHRDRPRGRAHRLLHGLVHGLWSVALVALSVGVAAAAVRFAVDRVNG